MQNKSQPNVVYSVADLSHCAQKVQDFYRYWDRKRAGRLFPARSDIDPTEMREYLQMLILIDVVDTPPRYLYRLVGTKEVEGRGRDPTGLAVSEASYGDPKDAIAFYDLIVDNQKPAIYVGEYLPKPGWTTKEQVLGLPLSNDGVTVNMILVYSVIEWLKETRLETGPF